MARSFQSPEGLTIEEAFSFVSGLYFRGKLAYAKRFAFTPGTAPSSHIFIIVPGFGLVSPGWKFTAQRTQIMQQVRVDPRDHRFRAPLETHAMELKAVLGENSRVILLGSIASGKYVDILSPIFGDCLFVPRSFVGIGDMSRGALLLETFFTMLPQHSLIQMTPVTTDLDVATEWFNKLGSFGCDGIMAKKLGEPYHSGDREAMVKVKRLKTADCVVGEASAMQNLTGLRESVPCS